MTYSTFAYGIEIMEDEMKKIAAAFDISMPSKEWSISGQMSYLIQSIDDTLRAVSKKLLSFDIAFDRSQVNNSNEKRFFLIVTRVMLDMSMVCDVDTPVVVYKQDSFEPNEEEKEELNNYIRHYDLGGTPQFLFYAVA